MKKLAIIGMIFAGLMLSTASAWATPTGMTKPEYRALMLRSEALNQKYGLYEYAQPGLLSQVQSGPKQAVVKSNVNQKLGEIGAWAVPSNPKASSTKLNVNQKLGEIGAWAVPSNPKASSSGNGLDWSNAGIGAALVVGVAVLGVGSLLTVRHQRRPIPH
jgi:hypothetical protein